MKKLFYIDIYGYVATSRYAGCSKFISSFEEAISFLLNQSKNLFDYAHCKKVTFSILHNDSLHYEGVVTKSGAIQYSIYEGVVLSEQSSLDLN